MRNVFATRSYLLAYRRHFGSAPVSGRAWHRVRVEGATAFLQSRGRTARRLEWWGAGIHDIGGPHLDSPAENTSYDVGAMWKRIEELARRPKFEFDGRHAADHPVSRTRRLSVST